MARLLAWIQRPRKPARIRHRPYFRIDLRSGTGRDAGGAAAFRW